MGESDKPAGLDSGVIKYCFPKIASLGSVLPVIGLDIGHNLLAPGVEPFAIDRRSSMNKQLAVSVPLGKYYPFAGRDEWMTVERLLSTVGVKRIGFCESALLIWPTRRFIRHDMSINELLRGIDIAMDELFHWEPVEFDEDDFKFPCRDCGFCNRTFQAMLRD